MFGALDCDVFMADEDIAPIVTKSRSIIDLQTLTSPFTKKCFDLEYFAIEIYSKNIV